jgi:hypothetical protein
VIRSWSPRCCLSCGEPLEEWRWPLTIGGYVACNPCAVLYLVTDDGLERVLLSLEPPELRRAFEELLEAWWAKQQRRHETPARAAA